MCMNGLSEGVSVKHMRAGSIEARKGHQNPQTWGFRQLWAVRCWESNPVPPEEQKILLTIEPSQQTSSSSSSAESQVAYASLEQAMHARMALNIF